MTYPDSVQFLYALGNEMKTAKLGLERIRAVLDALGQSRRRRTASSTSPGRMGKVPPAR